MDLKDFLDLFYASHYVPIICVKDGQIDSLTGLPEGIMPMVYDRIKDQSFPSYPAQYTKEDLGFYGIICYEERKLIFGPVFDTEISQDMVRQYMKENIIPHGRLDDVYGFLVRIPRLTYNQFLNMLTFIHFSLNHERTDAYSYLTKGSAEEIAVTHQEAVFQNREHGKTHGTYLFEQQMIDYIKRGNPEGLRRFLLRAAIERPLTPGVMADSPLRQAKNIMQGLIAYIGKAAAVPGGMDVERAYQLMDSYALECERQRTVDDVTALQFQMLIDFAERVGQAQMPQDYTPEVYACVQYINANLNGPVEIDDIADHIGRSRSYVTTHFKKEMGLTVTEYITQARVREAKNLLRYSSKSLCEISEYLCFSSQPHFQRVFKQKTGLTPGQYRDLKKGKTMECFSERNLSVEAVQQVREDC